MPLLLLLASLFLSACALSSPLPLWHGESITQHFAATVVGQEGFPVQGGLELDSTGGRLALILQQGRTLGQCTLRPHEQTMTITGTAAAGLGSHAKALTTRIATALYTVISHTHNTPPQHHEYSLTTTPEGLVYTDKDGDIIFHLEETS